LFSVFASFASAGLPGFDPCIFMEKLL